MADEERHPGLVPLYGSTALLEELRLLRRMGDGGRTAAARALQSARLGWGPENPGNAAPGAAAPTLPEDRLKFVARALDAAIVAKGGTSIFAPRPRGELSPAAEARLEAWQWLTPRRHADATGRKPKDEPEGKR